MDKLVHVSFERNVVVFPVSEILPRRRVTPEQQSTVKYKRIVRSIKEIGLIEPLIVSRIASKKSQCLLLDGHLRLAAMNELGYLESRCLIADDDEAFTYNKRVNRLATIQEHFMIMKALKSGVSETKLAKALNVDIEAIKRRRSLLDGICPEVVEMLKDKMVNPTTFETLRKMRPLRQIEVAELMILAGNWTGSYAKALLAATRQEELAQPEKPKKIAGITAEQMARMEREMSSLQQDFKQIEQTYGDDILHLVIASGYLSKLVRNSKVERYLGSHHSEILREFKSIISATSLDKPEQVLEISG